MVLFGQNINAQKAKKMSELETNNRSEEGVNNDIGIFYFLPKPINAIDRTAELGAEIPEPAYIDSNEDEPAISLEKESFPTKIAVIGIVAAAGTGIAVRGAVVAFKNHRAA
jgi:hypothetical protein